MSLKILQAAQGALLCFMCQIAQFMYELSLQVLYNSCLMFKAGEYFKDQWMQTFSASSRVFERIW